ncbi:hypothetical protein Lal_00033841 [Lupinus albus]|nr:hypothetical protein Lal_00033841 [Lupinus albus]
MAVNSFPGLVHTARHTMGAGHARSRYLNRKEGDAEGRASDWSEAISYWVVWFDTASHPKKKKRVVLQSQIWRWKSSFVSRH